MHRTCHPLARLTLVVGLALVPCAASSCQSAYFAAMEKFGYAKREILVDRVEDAREEQAQAQKQFVSTYERFKQVTGIQGGKLEKTYQSLSSAYEDCSDRAQAVRERITAVEEVAQAMFREWKSEIGEYSDPTLKRQSQETFDATRRRYDDLLRSMLKASASMDPVLTAFRDRVLFLKHNLNAQAIRSLSETAVALEGDVSKLIADMQASIAEADEFLGAMKPAG
ncbi:MAG: DUF2959 domain-containing protein [Planctomycetes bacterium]|nr:DUF2959 domain-containing protein [Planctomycetota bacterium]